MDRWFIYCLQLEQGHWFLGRIRENKYPKAIRNYQHGKGRGFTNKQYAIVDWKVIKILPAYMKVTDVDVELRRCMTTLATRTGADKVHSQGKQLSQWELGQL